MLLVSSHVFCAVLLPAMAQLIHQEGRVPKSPTNVQLYVKLVNFPEGGKAESGPNFLWFKEP